MKRSWKRFFALALSLAFCLQSFGLASEAGASSDGTEQPIYHASNLTLPVGGQEGEYVEVDSTAMSTIKTLQQGTLFVRFTPSQTNTIQSLVGFSNGDMGYPHSYVHLYFKNDRIGFEIRQQSGGDYEKTYALATFVAGQEYFVGMTADPEYGYRI